VTIGPSAQMPRLVFTRATLLRAGPA
jgi:hypothetical protein